MFFYYFNIKRVVFMVCRLELNMVLLDKNNDLYVYGRECMHNHVDLGIKNKLLFIGDNYESRGLK